MNSFTGLSNVLIVMLAILIFMLIILTTVYVMYRMKEKTGSTNEQKKESTEKNPRPMGTQSIFKFMEFDKIEDNMIIQKNDKRYLMAIECQGVNYDLMSGVEKTSVERGFIEFLNALRYPIQIYVQTRKVNLEDSIATYKEKLSEIERRYEQIQMQYEQMKRSGNYSDVELKKQYFEVIKARNLYEYGQDVIYNTETMSLNKNILNKNYYVIIPYYPEDLGENLYDKEEIKNIAFSELYTKAQSMIATLGACGINAYVLDSNELVELLYVAYNRDESDTYGINKAIEAGYDELFTTSQDVLEKRMYELDKEIENKAVELARQKLDEAKSEIEQELAKKESKEDDLIKDLAKRVLRQNRAYLDDSTLNKALEKLEGTQEKKKEKVAEKKEEKGDEGDETKKVRRVRKGA